MHLRKSFWPDVWTSHHPHLPAPLTTISDASFFFFGSIVKITIKVHSVTNSQFLWKFWKGTAKRFPNGVSELPKGSCRQIQGLFLQIEKICVIIFSLTTVSEQKAPELTTVITAFTRINLCGHIDNFKVPKIWQDFRLNGSTIIHFLFRGGCQSWLILKLDHYVVS